MAVAFAVRERASVVEEVCWFALVFAYTYGLLAVEAPFLWNVISIAALVRWVYVDPLYTKRNWKNYTFVAFLVGLLLLLEWIGVVEISTMSACLVWVLLYFQHRVKRPGPGERDAIRALLQYRNEALRWEWAERYAAGEQSKSTYKDKDKVDAALRLLRRNRLARPPPVVFYLANRLKLEFPGRRDGATRKAMAHMARRLFTLARANEQPPIPFEDEELETLRRVRLADMHHLVARAVELAAQVTEADAQLALAELEPEQVIRRAAIARWSLSR
jgi:hypothetical protein